MKLLCRFFGHKRGKRISTQAAKFGSDVLVATFQCPRCATQWQRRIAK